MGKRDSPQRLSWVSKRSSSSAKPTIFEKAGHQRSVSGMVSVTQRPSWLGYEMPLMGLAASKRARGSPRRSSRMAM